jgi:hypothetical protein
MGQLVQAMEGAKGGKHQTLYGQHGQATVDVPERLFDVLDLALA